MLLRCGGCLIALLVAWCTVASAEDITVITTDSVVIAGTYYAPGAATAPAVVCVHMLGKDRRSWSDFAQRLQGQGYAVLTLDLRGHGQSLRAPGRELSLKTLTEADFAAMYRDVAAAVDWLRHRPDVDAKRIGLVGASIGANVALQYAALDTLIRGVVLISPGQVYRGVKLEPAMKQFGVRPVLLVAAEDDNYSLVTVRSLSHIARAPVDTLIYPEGGHGTYLLRAALDLSERIIKFLDSHLR
jgi:dienelactone hydrolase